MPESRLRHRLTVAAVVLAALLVLFSTPLWRLLSNTIDPVILSLQTKVHGLTSNWLTLTSGPHLAQENEQLRQELATADSEVAEVTSLTRTNQQLEALAGVPASPRFSSVGAEIIGRVQDESGTSYLLDRGSRDGLEPGVAVEAGLTGTGDSQTSDGLLVGLVRDVTPDRATFTLTTASGGQVIAEVLNSSHSRGVATGEYGLGLELQFVPLNDTLAVGDQVVTSNLDDHVPAGLLIGSVSAVTKHENDFFLTATLTPPEPLEYFRFVRILIPNSP